jgi:hypothetical protein
MQWMRWCWPPICRSWTWKRPFPKSTRAGRKQMLSCTADRTISPILSLSWRLAVLAELTFRACHLCSPAWRVNSTRRAECSPRETMLGCGQHNLVPEDETGLLRSCRSLFPNRIFLVRRPIHLYGNISEPLRPTLDRPFQLAPLASRVWMRRKTYRLRKSRNARSLERRRE